MLNGDYVSNILKFFIGTNQNLFLIVDDLKLKATIHKLEDPYIFIKPSIDFNLPKLPYGITCLIPYGKDLFYFVSEAIDVDTQNIIKVVSPSSIQKKHDREYERYNVEGILFTSMNIIKDIDEEKFLERLPNSFRKVLNSVKVNEISYESIVETIMNILRERYKISLFIDEYSQLPWLKYCRYNHLGLVIPDMNPDIFLQPIRLYGFASYGYFLESSKRSILDREVKMVINYHSLKEASSYVYLPLFIVDTLIGYIFVGSERNLNLLDIKDQIELFKLLGLGDVAELFFCYERFFKLNEHRDYPIPVVDISFGGIKIKIDKHIAYFLNKGDNVKLYFKIGNKFFELLGEVIRVGYEDEKFVSAIRFLNMSKEDFYVIKKWFSNIERW
ncbi:MAG: PilZ domain-containing protein [Brevinematia bacterium]